MPKSKTKSVSNAVPSNIQVSSSNVLNTSAITRIDSVRFYDVGQGDCIGLETDEDVHLYVDYGGLLDHPDPTPNGVKSRLPIKSGMSIILTHWDWDHYNSAKYNQDAVDDAEWIVPRQLVGPRALKFASSLRRAACWPDSAGATAYRFNIGAKFQIQIEKCAASPTTSGQKEDRNLTGLAVTIYKLDAQDNDDKYVLLPGDAPYDKIPSVQTIQGKCLGMLAYHHGSKRHWIKATDNHIPTKQRSSKKLIYSYGPSNSYGHPNRDKYEDSDWDDVGVTSEEMASNGNTYEKIKF